jgi:hypothetical protein
MFSQFGLRSGICLLSTVIYACLTDVPANADSKTVVINGLKVGLSCGYYDPDQSSPVGVNYDLEVFDGGYMTAVDLTIRKPAFSGPVSKDTRQFLEPTVQYNPQQLNGSPPFVYGSSTVTEPVSISGVVTGYRADGSPIQYVIPEFATRNCY